MASDWTVIHETQTHRIPAEHAEGRILVSATGLEAATGWTLKPEGLCRGELCVPVRDRAALVDGDRIDLGAFAAAIDAPLVAEPAERVVAIGTAAAFRKTALESGLAPEFELPDLDGRLHTLSEHRGKKVLLIAYASW